MADARALYVLAGVDRAEAELIKRDCFSERTLRILDELRETIAREDSHQPTDQDHGNGSE